MYRVRLTSFPNTETRLVLSKLNDPRPVEPSESKPSPALLKECSYPSVESGLPAFDASAPHLTLALNSTPKNEIPQTRGRSGAFSLDARRKLLRAGGALERHDPEPTNCIFLTGTLPGSTRDAYRVMATEAPGIVHRVKKWIAKRYSSQSLSFYCWELQKRGALHLHYLVYCPEQKAKQRILNEFRQFWIDLLLTISVSSGVDMFAKSYGGTHATDTKDVQAYAQCCYSSVAAYMSKYVGKEAGKYSLEYAPPRWSGVSRPLGKLIEEYTETSVVDTPTYTQATALYNAVSEELTVSPAVCYKYRHKVGVGDTTLAYYNGNNEEQSCQHLSALMTMNSRNCSKRYLPSSKLVEMVYTLASLHSLITVQSFPGYPLSCHQLTKEWTSTSGATLQTFLTESRKRSSTSLQSNLKASLYALCSATHTSTLLSLSLPPWREPLRLLVRSLWHLAEGSDPSREITELQRIVKALLTSSDEVVHSCTSQSHPNDGAGEGYQLPLL